MNLTLTSARMCLCIWLGSILAMAQGTCVFSSDPLSKTVRLTGNCGKIAGVKAQTGYIVDNNQTQPPSPSPAEPPKLEDMSTVPPIVTYENGELTIVARNSTLSDILEAVRGKTGAEMEIPAGATNERVVSQIGPGPARDVLASLLNGSHFNYVMLGTEADPNSVAQLVLTPKAGASPENGPAPQTGQLGQSLALMPKAAAAPSVSSESGPAPQTEQPGRSSRALLQQLVPHTLPAWELQQTQQQQQAQQQQPEQPETREPAAAAKEPEVQGAVTQSQTAQSDAASSAPAPPEPANANDAQAQNSGSPEPQTPRQVLEGLYGARRAMIEQQLKQQQQPPTQ